MKFFIAATFIFILVFPLLVLAQDTSSLGKTGFEQVCGKPFSLGQCVVNLYRLSLGLGALVAMFMTILAGYRYMNAAGSAEQVEKAKESFAAAITGLIILFVAYALLYTINPDLVKFKDLTKLLPGPTYQQTAKVEAPANPFGEAGKVCGIQIGSPNGPCPTSNPSDPFPDLPGGGGKPPVLYGSICATSITGKEVCSNETISNASIGSYFLIYSKDTQGHRSSDPDGDQIYCGFENPDLFLQKVLAHDSSLANCRDPSAGPFVRLASSPKLGNFVFQFLVTDGLLRSTPAYVYLVVQTAREAGKVYSGDPCIPKTKIKITETYASGASLDYDCVSVNNGPWQWKNRIVDLGGGPSVEGCSASEVGQYGTVKYADPSRKPEQCVPQAYGVQSWGLQPI